MFWVRGHTDSDINNQQMSGLMLGVSDLTTSVLNMSFFAGLSSTTTARPKATRALNIVTGVKSDENLTTYAYSSKITFNIVSPAANLVGTLFKGSLRLGDFFAGINSASQPNTTISIDQLIALSTSSQVMQPSFTLQSAMVNDNLHSMAGASRSSWHVGTPESNFVNLGSEIIEYVVLQTPVVSITGGLMEFSLMNTVESNFAVLPSVANVLLYRTFCPIWKGKEFGKLKDLEYRGSTNVAPPVSDAAVSNFIEKLPGHLTTGSGSASSPMVSLADLNKCFSESKDPDEEVKLNADQDEFIIPSALSEPSDSSIFAFINKEYAYEHMLSHVPSDIIHAIRETPAHRLANPVVAAAITSILSNGFKLLQKNPTAQKAWASVKKKVKHVVGKTVKKVAQGALSKLTTPALKAISANPANFKKYRANADKELERRANASNKSKQPK